MEGIRCTQRLLLRTTMITRLNRRYIEQDSRFAVVQTFSAAHRHCSGCAAQPDRPDYFRRLHAADERHRLLLQLRAEGVDADVIMVHLANDAKRLTMPCDWARWIIWLNHSHMSGSGRRWTTCSAAGEERAARQLQSGGARSWPRLFPGPRCRHSLSRQKVCRVRRFRALRHICGLRYTAYQ